MRSSSLFSNLFKQPSSLSLGNKKSIFGLYQRNLSAPALNLGDQSELGIYLLFYSLKRQTPVKLRELLEIEKSPKFTILHAAQFLHEEIPIRLAHRIRELNKLPLGLSDLPAIRGVRNLYIDCFKRIKSLPKPKTLSEEADFTNLLIDVRDRNQNVQLLVAEGLQELCTSSEKARNHDFSHFLDKFYTSRIGMHLLIGQHIALHNPRTGYVGVIQTKLKLMESTQHAADAAAELCNYYYGESPKIVFEGDISASFTYVPSHVHYVLFEILKNSMRATAEFHEKADTLPPIKIVFSEGETDVCIKISDQGGGIPREGLSKIWSYSFSTAAHPRNQTRSSPMAGFGHGLPFSRLYCRYFGGNLEVMSLEGYGTDVYIYLNKIGDVHEATVH